MKLWEILKEGKIGTRYQCKSENGAYYSSVIAEVSKTTNGFCLMVVKDWNAIPKQRLVELCEDTVISEWEEIIPEPVYVDFITAWKAYCDGKQVKHKNWSNWVSKYDEDAAQYWDETEMVKDEWMIRE